MRSILLQLILLFISVKVVSSSNELVSLLSVYEPIFHSVLRILILNQQINILNQQIKKHSLKYLVLAKQNYTQHDELQTLRQEKRAQSEEIRLLREENHLLLAQAKEGLNEAFDKSPDSLSLKSFSRPQVHKYSGCSEILDVERVLFGDSIKRCPTNNIFDDCQNILSEESQKLHRQNDSYKSQRAVFSEPSRESDERSKAEADRKKSSSI